MPVPFNTARSVIEAERVKAWSITEESPRSNPKPLPEG